MLVDILLNSSLYSAIQILLVSVTGKSPILINQEAREIYHKTICLSCNESLPADLRYMYNINGQIEDDSISNMCMYQYTFFKHASNKTWNTQGMFAVKHAFNPYF